MNILLVLKTSLLFSISLLFFSACNVENSTYSEGGIGGSGVTLAEGGIGGSGVVLAEGGIGGSGVVMGNITGFGSVYVNGVKYDTTNTQFYRDGKLATQDEFSLGENIEVTGSVDGLTGTGVADTISYDSDIKGVVTVVSTDNQSIRIMGQDIITTPLTVLNGFEQLQDLIIDNYVEVSGSRDSAGILVASSIKLISSSFIDNSSSIAIEGEITRINEDLKMILVQDTIVDYSAVVSLDSTENDPKVGEYVEIESALNYINDKIVIASAVNPEKSYQHFEADTLLAVKGLVTDFDMSSPFSFRVAGQPVLITPKSRLLEGGWGDVFLDVVLSVEGLVNEAGELVASTIIISPLVKEALLGVIESVDGNKIRLQGRDIIINRATLLLDHSSQKRDDIKPNDLQVGTHIEVVLVEQSLAEDSVNRQDVLYTAVRINIID
ncbi:MAG: hypothetical protein KAH03_01045 [Cocleimonas sp.]|nr:hypothetical protein [Cocleimonas sp.]